MAPQNSAPKFAINVCFFLFPSNLLHFPKNQERQGVPARWGDPARGIPTAKPPTVRESHKPGPPLEPGPLALVPSQRGAEGGEGSRPEGGVQAQRGVGVPARGVLQPIQGQGAWEYHEPGPPNEPGPLAFSQKRAQNAVLLLKQAQSVGSRVV